MSQSKDEWAGLVVLPRQEGTMARQQILTDHNAIRAWAAARMGVPAVVDVSSQPGVQPHLLIAFDQVA